MPPEQTLKYKLQIDDTDLNSQLAQIRARIDAAVNEAFFNASSQQIINTSPIYAIPPTSPPVTDNSNIFENYFKNTVLPDATSRLALDVNNTVATSVVAAQNLYNDATNSVKDINNIFNYIKPKTDGSFSGAMGFGYDQRMPMFGSDYYIQNSRAFTEHVSNFASNIAPGVASIGIGSAINTGLGAMGVAASGPIGWAAATGLFLTDLAVSSYADDYKEIDKMQEAFQVLGQKNLGYIPSKEARNLALSMSRFINSDEANLKDFTKDEVSSGILNYAAAGGFRGSSDSTEIERKMRGVLDNLRIVSKTLEIFQDEAAQLMGDLEQKGIVTANQANLFASTMQTRANLVGMNGIDLIQAGLQGARQVVGTGMTAQEGFNNMVDAREEMARLSKSSNPYINAMIYDLGGEQGAANNLFNFNVGFTQTGMGQLNMATLMSGGNPYGQIQQKLEAMSGMFSNNPGNYLSMIGKQGELGGMMDAAVAATTITREWLETIGIVKPGGNIPKSQLVGGMSSLFNIPESYAKLLVEHNWNVTPAEKEMVAGLDSITGNFENYVTAISNQESLGSGGYNAVGRTITDPNNAMYGDHALGKFQFMTHTLKDLGYTGSEQEFLNNPELQNSYMQKFTAQNAIKWNVYADKHGLPRINDINNLSIEGAGILSAMHYAASGSPQKAAEIVFGNAGINIQKNGDPSAKTYIHNIMNNFSELSGGSININPLIGIKDKEAADFIQRQMESNSIPWYDQIWFGTKNYVAENTGLNEITSGLDALGQISASISKGAGNWAEALSYKFLDLINGTNTTMPYGDNDIPNTAAIRDAILGSNAEYRTLSKTWFNTLNKEQQKQFIQNDVFRTYSQDSGLTNKRGYNDLSLSQQRLIDVLGFRTTNEIQERLLDLIPELNSSSLESVIQDINLTREMSRLTRYRPGSTNSLVSEIDYDSAEKEINSLLMKNTNSTNINSLSIEDSDTFTKAVNSISTQVLGKNMNWDNLSNAQKKVLAEKIRLSSNIQYQLEKRGINFNDFAFLDANTTLNFTGSEQEIARSYYLNSARDAISNLSTMSYNLSDILIKSGLVGDKEDSYTLVHNFIGDSGNILNKTFNDFISGKDITGYESVEETLKNKETAAEDKFYSFEQRYNAHQLNGTVTPPGIFKGGYDAYDQAGKHLGNFNSEKEAKDQIDLSNKNQLEQLRKNVGIAHEVMNYAERTGLLHLQTNLTSFSLTQKTRNDIINRIDTMGIEDNVLREKMINSMTIDELRSRTMGTPYTTDIDKISLMRQIEWEDQLTSLNKKLGVNNTPEINALHAQAIREMVFTQTHTTDDYQNILSGINKTNPNLSSYTPSGFQLNDPIALQETSNNYLFDIVNILNSIKNGTDYKPVSITQPKTTTSAINSKQLGEMLHFSGGL